MIFDYLSFIDHHRNSSEEFWDEPYQFNPSRFEKRHVETYLPFSGGPRSCIGQNFAMIEAKIMLAMIIHRFHFQVAPGQKDAADISITLRFYFLLLLFSTYIHLSLSDQNMECG